MYEGSLSPDRDLIPSVLIKRVAIEAEIERLANLPAPANGRRVSLVACPAAGAGDGLTPGIAVSVCVLKPGELKGLQPL